MMAGPMDYSPLGAQKLQRACLDSAALSRHEPDAMIRTARLILRLPRPWA
jgi:hypothetical protein